MGRIQQDVNNRTFTELQKETQSACGVNKEFSNKTSKQAVPEPKRKRVLFWNQEMSQSLTSGAGLVPSLGMKTEKTGQSHSGPRETGASQWTSVLNDPQKDSLIKT